MTKGVKLPVARDVSVVSVSSVVSAGAPRPPITPLAPEEAMYAEDIKMPMAKDESVASASLASDAEYVRRDPLPSPYVSAAGLVSLGGVSKEDVFFHGDRVKTIQVRDGDGRVTFMFVKKSDGIWMLCRPADDDWQEMVDAHAISSPVTGKVDSLPQASGGIGA